MKKNNSLVVIVLAVVAVIVAVYFVGGFFVKTSPSLSSDDGVVGCSQVTSCGSSQQIISEPNSTESDFEDAKTVSLKICDANVLAAKRKVLDCLTKAQEACILWSCDYSSKVNDKSFSCTPVSCTETTKTQVCTYKIGENGKPIQPGSCVIGTGGSIGWVCKYFDGYYSGVGTCVEPSVDKEPENID